MLGILLNSFVYFQICQETCVATSGEKLYLSLKIMLEFLILNVLAFLFRLMLVGTMLVLLCKNIPRKLLRLNCLKHWKKRDY